jgi:hypothetical protein
MGGGVIGMRGDEFWSLRAMSASMLAAADDGVSLPRPARARTST